MGKPTLRAIIEASVVAPVLLAASLVAAALSIGERPSAARSDQPDEPAPTPITTEVTPVVVHVQPIEQLVTPEKGEAEAETMTAMQGDLGDSSSSNPFTGVRADLSADGRFAALTPDYLNLVAHDTNGFARMWPGPLLWTATDVGAGQVERLRRDSQCRKR